MRSNINNKNKKKNDKDKNREIEDAFDKRIDLHELQVVDMARNGISKNKALSQNKVGKCGSGKVVADKEDGMFVGDSVVSVA